MISSIQETGEGLTKWKTVMKEEIIEALLKLEKLPIEESDTILSLVGGEYGALVAGDKAVTNDN